MFERLPLIALRAFESAARLQSVKRAADELHVTPTAVSHQIRRLEQELGNPLFLRQPRRITLTSQGRRLYERLHQALREMVEALEPLRSVPAPGILTLTTTHSFAALWLVPRLHRFRALCPEVRVRLEGRPEIVDLLQDHHVDIAIRYGGRTPPGLDLCGVWQETLGVYGSRSRVAEAENTVPRLISVTWHGSTLYAASWRRWSDLAGSPWPGENAAWLEYGEEHYAMQAAIAGEGLVLASSVLVAESVEKGLLHPYRSDVQVPGGIYRVLCTPGRQRHPPVRQFLDWLVEELAGTGDPAGNGLHRRLAPHPGYPLTPA